MKNKKLPIVAILLLISILNYTKIQNTETIRPVEFLSIFAIGMLSGVLIVGLVTKFKNNQ